MSGQKPNVLSAVPLAARGATATSVKSRSRSVRKNSVGLEVEALDRERGAALGELIVELGNAATGVGIGPEHMIVGHQQRWRHQEAGAQPAPAAAEIGDDPTHRATRHRAFVEEAYGEEITRRTDDPLDDRVGHGIGRHLVLRDHGADFIGQCLRGPRLRRHRGHRHPPLHRVNQPVDAFGQPLRALRFGVLALVDGFCLGVPLLLARLEVVGSVHRDVEIEGGFVAGSAHGSLQLMRA